MYILFNLVSHVIYTNDVDDYSDIRTLREYVHNRESHKKDLEIKNKQLWRDCFYTTEETSLLVNGTLITTWYNHRPNCPQSKFEQLYKNRQDLKNFEKDTSEQIGQIIAQGVSINAGKKNYGTILNSAKSRVLYNVLRDQGADFQVTSFVNMNKPQLIAMGILIAAWGLFLNNCLNVKINYRKNRFMQAGINTCDEQGRTPLMNFIIAQEAQLKPFRQCMSDPGIVTFILKTNQEVTRLVKCGADINIKDCYGKTIMNYCKTIDFYQHLYALGGPFDVKQWAVLQRDYLIPFLAVSTVMLIAMRLSMFESTADINGSIGEKFDDFFKKTFN